ncbi:hypothetical protein RND61_11825 [Streptomyces sp. TRM76323]|uniref:Histidine kinase n=1 Tax=Streptomyces tamarix TaxID=3078565 RepID=A0ABU3QJ26_9ACTN|nr:hypothetical protein [Streptomyces tamarix]MDT9682752.1 hypothetical protein [Streptomyces tamarix]
MDLTPYVDHLRRELLVAASIGGDEVRALAERLAVPLESTARLTLLNALSTASREITRELAPGSVEVRLRGLDPEFAVTAPPAPEAPDEVAPSMAPSMAPPSISMAPSLADGDEDSTARVNFRLPAPLKARVEDAAGQEGLSVNAWLLRAVAVALEPGCGPARPAGRASRHGRSHRGWAC